VKRLDSILAAFMLLTMQMLLAPRIAFGDVTPDFAVLLIALMALGRGPIQGAISGFVIGLFQDLFNPDLLGLNALAGAVTGYALSVAGSKMEPDNTLFTVALIAVAALLHDFIYLVVFTGLNLWKLIILFVTVSVPSAAYTAVAGIVVFKVASLVGAKAVRTFGKARP